MSTNVKARGYRLEHNDNGHFKGYTVVICEDGTLVTSWGKIGTAGQHKLESLTGSRARIAGERKVAEKVAKGYQVINDDVLFEIDSTDIEWAVERNEPKRLVVRFDAALRNPKYTGELDSVTAIYDRVLEQAQALMDNTATARFETVMNDWEELQTVWKTIVDKHTLTATTISMTQTALGRAMMSGKL